MEQDCKRKIFGFIQGTVAPEEFYSWFDSNQEAFDWLQNLIPEGKTIRSGVAEGMDFFLKNLSEEEKKSIYGAYEDLRTAMESNDEAAILHAKRLVDLLNGTDPKTVEFTSLMNLLLHSFTEILSNPSAYKPSYIKDILCKVREFFEVPHRTVREIPYDVRKIYSDQKTTQKIWTYVNIQGWLHGLMGEIFPEEPLTKDETLYRKASFLMDVCPEYIDGPEIDASGIIEDIAEQFPETLPAAKRKKLIKEKIKEAFHVRGNNYPRWIQDGEWPMGQNGVPMRFVEQKRKKGKEYKGTLYTQFFFEDTETGEIRVIDQFT